MQQNLVIICLILLTYFCPSIISTKNPSVIIIGAGSSGIAAAAHLLENSVSNITILEAENRVGGRVHTVEFGDGVVEMGAEFCDGIENNIVYDIAKDKDLLDNKNSFNSGVPKLYYSNGSTIDGQLSQNILKLVGNYLVEICNETDGTSVAEGFMKKFKTQIQDKYNEIQITKEATRLAEDVILTLEGTSSWQIPSARKHNRECNNLVLLSWKKKGFKKVFDLLKRNLTIDDKLLLNKKVSKINWNADKVVVETADNSLYKADHVIWTPSLGVLKEEKQTLFDPPLPTEQLEALQLMGYGGMMKIFLYFPTKWWKNEDKLFFLLWSQEDLDSISEEDSWISHISIVMQIYDNPNVLTIWIGSEVVPKVEKYSDEKLLNGCNRVIKKFLGRNYNVTSADKVLRTQWYSNPNFRGTFSYEKKENFQRNIFYQEKLTHPLKNKHNTPVVLFAGEATSFRHYGTVQGGIESGKREANRIIGFYRTT